MPLLAILLLLTACSSGHEHDASYEIPGVRMECREFSGPPQWSYCVSRPEHGPSGARVYHFHGRNMDARAWNDTDYYTGMVHERWVASGRGVPEVVTVSFGPVWVLTRKGEAPRSGLLEFFVDEALPTMEREIGVPRQRYLVGESMGGVNAIQIALHSPGLFQKVAALCPPVYEISPFASFGDKWRFVRSNGIELKIAAALSWIAPDYYSSQEEWDRNSPFRAIESVTPAEAPELYLACGVRDKYGCYPGMRRLSEAATRRGLNVAWHPIYGGHCNTDVASLAEFLSQQASGAASR